MIALIAILFLLNVNLWLRFHKLSKDFSRRNEDEYHFKQALKEDLDCLYKITSVHDESLLACNLNISSNKREIDSLTGKVDRIMQILEEPEVVSYASAEELEEVKQRIEQLENADFPAFDDKLAEGLQNLLNYSEETARGGNGIG